MVKVFLEGESLTLTKCINEGERVGRGGVEGGVRLVLCKVKGYMAFSVTTDI